MLKAFVDDSGSGGDSPWYVLAGYVGTVDGWDAFDERWRTTLHLRPKIEYFKSSEAESLGRDGQWAGVGREQRNQKIVDLIDVIAKCAQRAIHVRVRQQDYDEIVKPYLPPEWDNAYYFLFPAFVSAVVTMEKYSGSSDPVEFVFNRNERFEKPSFRLYGHVKDFDKFAGRVLNIHYEDEKVFLPLQAADLLAWQIRRRFCINEQPRPHCERSLHTLPDNPHSVVLNIDPLQEMGAAMHRDAEDKWARMGLLQNMRLWKR